MSDGCDDFFDCIAKTSTNGSSLLFVSRYWRFAQFFFPLLAMTSLGLALYRNYLALPVMVFGLWKFGFPEVSGDI
jgi:hypothetical protein